jgi:DNA (cytosine-5)-methyltransferase 1
LKHIGLFEGIGGFSLAASWVGWETLAWCEWNEFGQKVLKYHFPEAESFSDIKQSDFTKYNGKVDIITGGFPCQPYSLAGKRKGKDDDRHLWPEMLRVVREVQPSWVVGENVFGLINWNGGLVFDEVQADLEAEGYEVWPYVLPACAVNAPHRRDRIWFVAFNTVNNRHKTRRDQEEKKNGIQRECREKMEPREFNGTNISQTNTYTDSDGQHRSNGQHEKYTGERGQYALNDVEQVCDASNKYNQGLQGRTDKRGFNKVWENGNKQPTGLFQPTWQDFPTKPPICGGDDGIPRELDGITFPKWRNESIKAYGNAIVPQVAYEIFKVIDLMNNETNNP